MSDTRSKKSSNTLQEKMLKSKELVFISPHLDDAMLSCGVLLTSLVNEKKKIRVITMFTQASEPPYTKAAKKVAEKSGFSEPVSMFKERKREDERSLKRLKLSLHHKKFIDALWRKKKITSKLEKMVSSIIPELVHVYPTSKHLFSGKISKLDNDTRSDLVTEIENAIRPKQTIFAPLGIGGHIDHVMIRDVILSITRGKDTIFWEDFPYNSKHPEVEKFFQTDPRYYKIMEIFENVEKKKDLIQLYKSQLTSLFPDGSIPNIPERYYTYNFPDDK